MTRTQRIVGASATWGSLLLICIVLARALDGKVEWGPPNNTPDQCEKQRGSSFVREFQNTWSNLAYLGAGLLILFHARHLLGFVTGASFCYVAFCSGMYHASLRDPWQVLDVASVYWAMLALIVYGAYATWERWWKFPTVTSPVAVFGLVAGAITAPLVLAHLLAKTRLLKSEIVFAMLVVGLLTFSISALCALNSDWTARNLPAGADSGCAGRWAFFWITLGITTVGVTFQLLDGKDDPFCLPESIFQAHAHWHVLSAAALLFAYDFFSRCAGDRGRVFG